MYTAATIRHMMRLAGIREVEESALADSIWCSVCDPDDLPVLQRARQLSAGRPVVMGGFESIFPHPYLAWADYVVMGAGEGFIAEYGRDPRAALTRSNVISRERLSGEPDYSIRWERYPLVRLPGGNRYYYMGSRGCHRRCRFCVTGWSQPYSANSDRAIRTAVRVVEGQRGKLTLIGNDSRNLIQSPTVAAQSVTIVDYLREPERYKADMLHIGVEGWTEADRRWLGKPIPDEHLRELLRVSKRLGQRIELFLIAGYRGWSAESIRGLLEVLPQDADLKPQVHIKMTYLDPCPHTPLADEPVDPAYCDTRRAFFLLNAHCKRVRVFPTRSAGRSAWRTCLHRAAPQEALLLGRQPADTNRPESFEEFRAALRERGLEELLTRRVDWSRVRVRTR